MGRTTEKKPALLALDLEGILVPEIWISVAEGLGVEELRLTTRDIPDYDRLMKHRLRLLDERGILLPHIQAIIGKMEPCEGARDFLRWAMGRVPVVILSDTYYDFAMPLVEKLGFPPLFCNTLEVDAENRIVGYTLRQQDGKRKAVMAFKALGFRTAAVGDSYNDTGMLSEADLGVLFRPPENVKREFPGFKVYGEYEGLAAYLAVFFARRDG
jgi:phosphoserine / homoserine phosphotransferase